MPLNAAQIVTLACQDAKCPGYTVQGGQFLNAMLQDLCQDWDLDVAKATGVFTFNNGVSGTGDWSGTGSGPYQLPANYLRMSVIDGKDQFFYTIDGVPYPLIQVTMAEYQWLVQTPGFQSYPYNYATDFSTVGTLGYPSLYVWPPASGSYACTAAYYQQMPDIATPETSNVVPWFPNTMILQRGLAGRLMGLTGDKRQPEYLGGGEGAAALQYPLGFMTLLSAYLKNAKDREGAVKTVGRDRRRWGRPFDQLKNTKNIGWLIPLMFFAFAWASDAKATCTVPCTAAQLATDIGTQFPDNTTQQITPAIVRSFLLSVINSSMAVAPVVSGDIASFSGTTGLPSDSGVASANVFVNGTTSVANPTTGYQISGAATTAHYLRGNGTDYVDSAILAGDLPVIPTTSGSTSSAFGVVKVDGTTITANSSGVLTAVGASASSIDAGGATSISNGNAGDFLYQNGANVGHSGMPYGLVAAFAGAI